MIINEHEFSDEEIEEELEEIVTGVFEANKGALIKQIMIALVEWEENLDSC